MAKIFLSYSHADETYCDLLQKHLAALKHQGLIEMWHDRRIKPGDDFENSIDQQLNDAEIILLLVSSDFIASRYCYEVEMMRALERHDASEARVIPIILRPCDWHDTPFGKLLAAPKDGKPVKSWPDIDEAFLDIVRQIKVVLSGLGEKEEPTTATPIAAKVRRAPVVDLPRSANLTVRKDFTEADMENFLEDAFTFMAAYFENSLAEMEDRNPRLSTRFRRIDANHFTAVIYRGGEAVSRCKITLGGMFGRSIGFSYNDEVGDNSYNENLSVEVDDQHLFLRSMGMAMHVGGGERNLTEEGAAELYWSLLIQPLQ